MTKRFIYFIFLFTAIVLSFSVRAQFRIDRKIIIQNNQFYFFTIDAEHQLATIFTGSVKQKINKASKRLFPIGRSLDDPLIPLCFDINGDEFVGINWILSSTNSRYDAIKKISIKEWSKYRSEWSVEDWAQVSFDLPSLTANIPWEQMLEANNVLENCFFDLIKTDQTTMAICNQNKLRINRYDGTKWKLLATVPVSFTQYFTLVDRGRGKIGLLDAQGDFYHFNDQNYDLRLVRKNTSAKSQLLIVNKDNGKNYIISPEAIQAGTFNTITQLINESAIELNN